MANIGPGVPLTAEQVSAVFAYDTETGDLFWRKSGRVAGCLNGKGYVQVNFLNRTWLAHRVIWLLVMGEWSTRQIDHVNGVRSDNRWINLRRASNSENLRNRGMQRNNSTGFKGVSRQPDCDRFKAQIMVNGRSQHLGLFKTAEDAADAYKKAALKLHGAFAHSG